MRKQDILIMANKNLWRRPARTILTSLGVLIGTASIIIMLSLGIGLRVSMEESMAQWGNLNIIRIQGGMFYGPVDDYGDTPERRLNDEAVAEIKAIDGVEAVSPAYEINSEARWGRKNGWLNIVGLDLEVIENLELSVEHGRMPTKEERFTIIAGSQVINNFWDERAARSGRGMRYDQTFEEQDPTEFLNQRITVNVRNQASPDKSQNYNFMVVGILDETDMQNSWQVFGSIQDVKRIRDFINRGLKNSTSSDRTSDMVSVGGGRDTAFFSSREDTSDDYSFILVRTRDVEHTKKISADLKERGFYSYSIADDLEGIEKTSRITQAILGGIGAITLFVAAIGIINTMVMSIYERTREIGIIKVIGASFFDVRSLFLTEASLIGFIGGVFGLAVSYAASGLINNIYLNAMQGMMGSGIPINNISIIPPWLSVFAVCFSIFIGLVAGLYPANRAIKLDPITAIRNE